MFGATQQQENNQPVLAARDIYKSFGDLQVLKGVSLDAYRGDVISILGSSGSGKSTFLRCINLLERPESGDIILNGESLLFKNGRYGREAADKKQLARFRTNLAMVFQSFNLWSHLTIMENMIEAPIQVLKLKKADAIDRAQALLTKVGMLEKSNHYPIQLSGGQQQRVAIARALMMNPEVLLFDEPTSALDPELVGEVLKIMKDIALEGSTMIIVTHELAFAREVSDQIIFLHQGKIEEAGTPHQFFHETQSERVKQFLSNNLKG
ncbi:ABC transporter ATP-binding protein [Ostreibacterium oceani]|uniref:ATP-binding cassette domain-containing protein n=1 Tax=Ostreibacterium oceani TaxID=2654998 RepID=A0A6N7ET56_9GAMM|nr:ATP-binding cassette domain-containing protein [Ostreibacterium oceani]MPV85622.1 ATP-binding cassette domain-containing protein [Ostreibacterium oceani]